MNDQREDLHRVRIEGGYQAEPGTGPRGTPPSGGSGGRKNALTRSEKVIRVAAALKANQNCRGFTVGELDSLAETAIDALERLS